MLLLLLTWPQVRAVCLNHEVVFSQALTGNSPDLGYVPIGNLISSISRPTCFKHFMDICPPTPDLLLPPPTPVTV